MQCLWRLNCMEVLTPCSCFSRSHVVLWEVIWYSHRYLWCFRLKHYQTRAFVKGFKMPVPLQLRKDITQSEENICTMISARVVGRQSNGCCSTSWQQRQDVPDDRRSGSSSVAAAVLCSSIPFSGLKAPFRRRTADMPMGAK